MSGFRVLVVLIISIFFTVGLGCGDDRTSSSSDRNRDSNGDEIAADCDANGTCSCPSSLVACEQEFCVDISRHFDHCGECGQSCGNGEECVSGVCAPKECSDGKLACGGECVDVSDDPNACGRCDRSCFAGEQCASGQCICPEGNADCEAVGSYGEVVGGACETDLQCSGDANCVDEEEFPGGTCSVRCFDDEDCPSQTVCVEEGGGICLLGCDSDADCRNGYDCEEVNDVDGNREVMVCIHE